MKKLSVLAGLILIFVASGCTVDSSPEGIVATAADALQQNNLKLFKETLVGDASDQYGSLEGMTILQNAIQGAKTRMSEPESVSVKPSPDGRLIVYSVSILDQKSKQRLLDLTVDCDMNEAMTPPGCVGLASNIACFPAVNERCVIAAIQIDQR